jgi:hypothetical protein
VLNPVLFLIFEVVVSLVSNSLPLQVIPFHLWHWDIEPGMGVGYFSICVGCQVLFLSEIWEVIQPQGGM